MVSVEYLGPDLSFSLFVLTPSLGEGQIGMTEVDSRNSVKKALFTTDLGAYMYLFQCLKC